VVLVSCSLIASCSKPNAQEQHVNNTYDVPAPVSESDVTQRNPAITEAITEVITEAITETCVPPIETSTLPPATSEFSIALSKEQCVEDLDYMWKTLAESFPFIHTINRMIDLNMEEEFTRLKKSVENGKSDVFIDKWMDTLTEFCGKFGHIGHFSMVSAALYQNQVDFFATSSYIHPNRDTLVRPNVISAYQYLIERLSHKSNDGGYNFSFPDLELYCIDDHIAYIKSPSFGRDTDNDYERIITFLSSIGDSDNLIIDITGNGGGSDWYWRLNYVMPLINETAGLRLPVFAKNSQLVIDYLHSQGYTDYVNKDEADLSQYENLVEEDVEDMGIFFSDLVSYIEPLQDYINLIRENTDASLIIPKVPLLPVEIKFNGKIYLLIDSAVYSAAESFAVFCKQTGFATIVGRNSGGDGIGISPIMVDLPSGLLFMFSTLYGVNDDGSCNQEVGTTPDIISKSGESPLDTCLRIMSP